MDKSCFGVVAVATVEAVVSVLEADEVEEIHEVPRGGSTEARESGGEERGGEVLSPHLS